MTARPASARPAEAEALFGKRVSELFSPASAATAAGRADFSGEVYRPLGQGRRDATLWRWLDPFVKVVPTGR